MIIILYGIIGFIVIDWLRIKYYFLKKKKKEKRREKIFNRGW